MEMQIREKILECANETGVEQSYWEDVARNNRRTYSNEEWDVENILIALENEKDKYMEMIAEKGEAL